MGVIWGGGEEMEHGKVGSECMERWVGLHKTILLLAINMMPG